MNQVLTTEQCVEIMEKWRSSPIVRHYSFSDKKLWAKQEEILWAVRKYKRIAVKSCNSAGKTFTAADVALDWLITNPESIVVTTAPTFHQVETILWREIRSACFSAKIPIGAYPNLTELKFTDDWYAIGISTDNPVNFQGKHSKTGKLLVIGDEASGLPREIVEIIEALLPACILFIGNPLEANSPFSECFQSDLWHKITISAYDVVEWQNKNGRIPGLVNLEWINEMKDMHGLSSPWFRSHVLGEFPEEDEYALVQKGWVDRARKGLDIDGLELDAEPEAKRPRIIACDVATKHGENLTVIQYRYGHTIQAMRGYPRSTMTNTRDEIQIWHQKHESTVRVSDADGVGESLAEILAELSVSCLEFHGGRGARALDEIRFKNLRSQFYWVVAKKFEKGLYNLKHLDEKSFEILRGQLCSIRVKEPDNLGRFQIETKEEMATRQIKSPDYADTFMMAEYGYYMSKMADVKPRTYGSL